MNSSVWQNFLHVFNCFYSVVVTHLQQRGWLMYTNEKYIHISSPLMGWTAAIQSMVELLAQRVVKNPCVAC